MIHYYTLPKSTLAVLVRVFLFTCMFLLLSFPGWSQSRTVKNLPPLPEEWGLIENNGQLEQADVLFYGAHKNAEIYLRAGHISFQFTSTKPFRTEGTGPQPLEIETALLREQVRIDMVLVGANLTGKIETLDQQPMRRNFFLGHTSQGGIRDVKSYRKVTFRDVYPQIDMLVEAHKEGLKYSFLVHPGGDPSQIRIRWEGMKHMGGAEELMLYTDLIELIEERPLTYTTTGKRLCSKRVLSGDNEIGFEVCNDGISESYTIDPLVRWGTLYGGDRYDGAFDVVTDGEKNIYMLGTTSSWAHISTPGRHRDTIWMESTDTASLKYAWDVYLAKFDSSGYPIWGTYYGGPSADFGMRMVIDGSHNLVIAGQTGSYTGIATPDGPDTSYGSGSPGAALIVGDGYVAKFDTAGFLLWGTYVGAHRFDGIENVAVDADDNIYAVGWTNSNTGMTTSGTYNNTYRGGNFNLPKKGGDVILMKYDKNGNKLWGTYYGGADDDLGYGVTADDRGNAYIAGYTESWTHIGIGNKWDTAQQDGFVAKFDSTGQLVWSRYMAGLSGNMTSFMRTIQWVPGAGLYASGFTTVPGLSTQGAHQDTVNQGGDILLARLDTSGDIIWSTYLGGDGRDESVDLTPYKNGGIAMSGISSSTFGITRGDGQYPAPNNSSDVLAVQFDSSGRQLWGTLRGGDGEEIGNGIVIDPAGVIYIAGATNSFIGVSTFISYQNMGYGSTDAFLLRYDTIGYCFGEPGATFNGDTVVCAGEPVTYTAASYDNTIYTWDATGGNIIFGANSDIMQVRWDSAGEYTLMMRLESAKACMDTAWLSVKVIDAPKADIALEHHCFGTVMPLKNNTAGDVSHYWDFGDGTGSSLPQPGKIYIFPGTYRVRYKVKSVSTACQDSVAFDVTVFPPATPDFTVTLVDSETHTYQFKAIDSLYQTYYWDFGDGDTSTHHSPIHTYTQDGEYWVKVIATTGDGCADSGFYKITVSTAGIAGQQSSPTVQVYPNPFNTSVNIELEMANAGPLRLSLCDVQGRELAVLFNQTHASGKQRFTLNEDKFSASGVYLLRIQTGESVTYQRLLKQE